MVTQLDIYTEEKFEDEEDLRERSLANHRRTVSDSEVIVQETLDVARQYDELYPMIVSALACIREVLEREDDVYAFSSSFVYVIPHRNPQRAQDTRHLCCYKIHGASGNRGKFVCSLNVNRPPIYLHDLSATIVGGFSSSSSPSLCNTSQVRVSTQRCPWRIASPPYGRNLFHCARKWMILPKR